jgi:hypothetical protein
VSDTEDQGKRVDDWIRSKSRGAGRTLTPTPDAKTKVAGDWLRRLTGHAPAEPEKGTDDGSS